MIRTLGSLRAELVLISSLLLGNLLRPFSTAEEANRKRALLTPLEHT